MSQDIKVNQKKLQTLCLSSARVSDHHPHFESPQLRQVMHPSSLMTALVEHLTHSCASEGKSHASSLADPIAPAAFFSSARFSAISCWRAASGSSVLMRPISLRWRSMTSPRSATSEGVYLPFLDSHPRG